MYTYLLLLSLQMQAMIVSKNKQLTHDTTMMMISTSDRPTDSLPSHNSSIIQYNISFNYNNKPNILELYIILESI